MSFSLTKNGLVVAAVALSALVLTYRPAVTAPIEKPIYERVFGDWTVSVVRDLVLLRNNCLMVTTAPGGKTEADTARLRLEHIRRVRLRTWTGAIYLPGVSDESEIVLEVDNTTKRGLESEHVSASTAYLSDEYMRLVEADFVTGELLGENVTVTYYTADGDQRSATFSLYGFTDGKEDLEFQCKML